MDLIADYGTVLLILAVFFSLCMTWGIGANDVANAMGSSVGSGAITVKKAIIIAAVFEFAGAFLAGGHVTGTIREEIITPSAVADRPEVLVLGMLAALLAGAVWLFVASSKGWPVSTTHTIVGAIIGLGIASSTAVNWENVAQIGTSWILSPLLGGVLAYGLMASVRRPILNTEFPFENARRFGPLYLFLAGFVIALITLFKGLVHLDLTLSAGMSVLAAVVIGLLVACAGFLLISRVTIDPEANRDYHFASVERVFTPMMIFTACAMAFAHGSNDVANGTGPLAAVLDLVRSGGIVAEQAPVPPWVLALGGFGILLGIATLGYRVMLTVGSRITALTPTRGFCATLAAAATVALASRSGLPVSTTHVVVGAVMGVGMARGVGAMDLRVLGGILLAWVVTLPVGAALAAVFYFTLKGIFG